MKKRFLKRIGALILVCFMVVLNVLGSLFPVSADGSETPTAKIYYQYQNLVTKGEDLFADVYSYLFNATVSYDGAMVPLYEAPYVTIRDIPINHFVIAEAYYSSSEEAYVVKLRLQDYRYYVLKNLRGVESASLVNISNESLGSVISRYQYDNPPEYHDSYIFYTDSEYLYLKLNYYFRCELYEVESFDADYDVSKSTFDEDMRQLFDGRIDLSQFPTKNVFLSQRTSPYIDIVAAYSDAVYGEWGTDSYQTGTDYLYIYNCYGETPVSGQIVIEVDGGATVEIGLTRISGSRYFTKFQANTKFPRRFGISNSNTVSKISSIRLNFSGGDSRLYPFTNFYIITEYTNHTDWEIRSVRFEGKQKLKLDIGYTYWRQADYSSKGLGWHNQVDSIYFGVPSTLLQNQRLVDAKLEYQKATTKPIVVTKTSDNINGTYVHDWFETTAADPTNELTADWGWVRYEKGKPYFSTFDDYYSYNIRGSGRFNEYLKSIYWAFNVEDPSIVDKIPNNGSVYDLSSAALSDSRSTVPYDQLEQWMLNYSLVGAETTYTAANPAYKTDPTQPETVQVNGILFDDVQERGTYYASQIAGRVLEEYGNNNNFFSNLAVGWRYALAHLFKGAHSEDITLSFCDFVIDDIHDIDDENDANGVHKFAMIDMVDLQDRFRKCQSNGETLILMPFDTSQYYSQSFLQGKYKEGNVDSGSEADFEGYLAIEDMYLDLHVLELYFENAVGEVIPMKVESNHINGISDVTPAPESGDLDHAAGENLKNYFQNQGKNFLDLLKKLLAIIVAVVIVLIVLRLVNWFAGGKRGNNTTVVIREDSPPRKHRWRR